MEFNIYYILLYIPVIAFGIVVGSFSNVLIYRLPREISFAKGFSKCTNCGHRLYAKDLIPVLSYIFLHGKCRYCKEKISPRYPLIELLNSALYVICFWKFGFTLNAAIFCVISTCLMVIAFIDWEHMIIPDIMNMAVFLCGLALLWLQPTLWRDKTIGFFCVSTIFLLIVVVSRGRAMGGGDIKLMAAVGLCLGWQMTFFATAAGSIIGTIIYIMLNKTKHSLGRQVSFGSFLCVGAIISMFFGDTFLTWYISLLR